MYGIYIIWCLCCVLINIFSGLIQIGDLMEPITSILVEKSKYLDRKFVISMLWLFIITPLAFYNKISELTFTSLLSAIGSYFFGLIVIIYSVL